MEPPREQVITRWVIYTHVQRLYEEPKGFWWVQFNGSQESLYFGEVRPFSLGDKVKVTFERVK